MTLLEKEGLGTRLNVMRKMIELHTYVHRTVINYIATRIHDITTFIPFIWNGEFPSLPPSTRRQHQHIPRPPVVSRAPPTSPDNPAPQAHRASTASLWSSW